MFLKERGSRYNWSGMKEKTVTRLYQFDDATYEVRVVFRCGRYLRLKKASEPNAFRLGSPYHLSWKEIDAFVIKGIPKLLKRTSKREKEPYDGRYLYVLGEKREVGELSKEEIKRLYKKECYALVEERFRAFEKEMGVTPPYAFRFREMKTRLGSNSKKTHAITVSYGLLAYSLEVVDSVLYHELAHHFHFDHSPKFYKVLLKYCPDYDACRKRILAHDYEGNHHLES